MHRIILHVDMDAFFASVEQLDNPHLKGKPVIVGGVSERGVVSTCSYEARKFGVKSAMPVFMAQRLCPKGYFVRVRYHRYKEISNKIFAIFREVTQLVEPLSIDEAYLDVTNSRFTSGMEAAIYIKNRVFKEIGLTLSIGISYNKFLAKLASDWNKPNGIKVIEKDMIPEILLPLSISKIYGLGKKSVQRLNNMGIYIIRIVEVNRDRKSYGRETTLKFDTHEIEELEPYIQGFCKELTVTLIRQNIYIKTITIKYKTIAFENHTRSRTLNTYTNNYEIIYKTAMDILQEEELENYIRLIGVTLSSIREENVQQLTLF